MAFSSHSPKEATRRSRLDMKPARKQDKENGRVLLVRIVMDDLFVLLF